MEIILLAIGINGGYLCRHKTENGTKRFLCLAIALDDKMLK